MRLTFGANSIHYVPCSSEMNDLFTYIVVLSAFLSPHRHDLMHVVRRKTGEFSAFAQRLSTVPTNCPNKIHKSHED